jgi:tetratricopeptide (TPR) repeat protein
MAKQTKNSSTGFTLPVWVVVVTIVLATLLAYLPAFDAQKEFTNWDDNLYVTDQPMVTEFTADSLGKMFDLSTGVASNYHPLTMLSLALNYAVTGSSARGIVAVNVLLHILNALLVFQLLRKLTSGNVVIAGLAGLWFAIHPMHVESVAWVSERKDVLYTLFLLLSFLAYISYVTSKKYVYLGLTFVSFIASCLAKAMAVPLPIALLLFDYWYDRKFDMRSVLEKVPFLAVSVWLGLVAIGLQQSAAIAKFEVLTLAQRFAFTGYGFVMYWVKMIVPFDLSTFYPYPTTKASGNVAWWYFVMPVLAVAMIIVPVLLLRGKQHARKVVVMSMGLYVLFIALVLQFVSVGQVIMAERYTYVPYVGSLFLLAYGVYELSMKRPALAKAAAALYTIALLPVCYTQVGTWKNSETLWTRVIDLYPYEFTNNGSSITVTRVGAPVAYGGRASYYYDKNQIDKAFADLRVIEIVKARGWKLWQALGIIYGMKNEYAKSQECFATALNEQPDMPSIYYNRGISYAFAGMPDRAREDFRAALTNGIQGDDRYKSLSGLARESLKLGDNESCLTASEQTIREYPDRIDGYFLKGTALVNLKRQQEAVPILERATAINPNDASAWFNLAIANRDIGNSGAAREAANKAKALGFRAADALLQNLR